MTCTPPIRTIRTETVTCFSKGGAAPGTSDIFVLSPESMVQIGPMLSAIRVTVIVENATTDFICQAAFQSTSDGCTWDTAITLESAQSDNRKTTTDWYTTVNNFKRGIRVGVVCTQEAGVSTVQMARVTLIIDMELRT